MVFLLVHVTIMLRLSLKNFCRHSVVHIDLSFKVHLVDFKVSSRALEENTRLITYRVVTDGKCLSYRLNTYLC